MDTNEYQQLSQRTECDQRKARLRIMASVAPRSVETLADQYLSNDPAMLPTRLIHACIGITKEGGELLSVLEKWLYFGKPFTMDELKQRYKDELGDVLWYVAEACNALGLDMGEVMLANVAKLKARYPEKFSEERAADENRNRQAEEEAVRAKNIREHISELGSTAKAVRKAVQTPHYMRTVEQVQLLRGTVYGCCSRYADNQRCDCLEIAGSNIVRNQNQCPKGGQHVWNGSSHPLVDGHFCGKCGVKLPSLTTCTECNGNGYTGSPNNGFNSTMVRCSKGCPVRCSVCNNPNCDNPNGQH